MVVLLPALLLLLLLLLLLAFDIFLTLHPRVEVAAGGNGSVEPDHKITPAPLRILQFASTMMLLARSYRTAIT